MWENNTESASKGQGRGRGGRGGFGRGGRGRARGRGAGRGRGGRGGGGRDALTSKFTGAGAEEHAVEADSALLSALLTGVNRAFPYVPDDDVAAVIESHTPVLFRMVSIACTSWV